MVNTLRATSGVTTNPMTPRIGPPRNTNSAATPTAPAIVTTTNSPGRSDTSATSSAWARPLRAPERSMASSASAVTRSPIDVVVAPLFASVLRMPSWRRPARRSSPASTMTSSAVSPRPTAATPSTSERIEPLAPPSVAAATAVGTTAGEGTTVGDSSATGATADTGSFWATGGAASGGGATGSSTTVEPLTGPNGVAIWTV